ncbi:MAG: hypothetical protein Q9175_000169 [Cornicularia normoerica]
MTFEMLADEWVAIQGMFWRWGDVREGRSEVRAADAISGVRIRDIEEIGRNVAFFFREVGATHLGITPERGQLFRKNFESLLSLLSAHFERQPFLLGSSVSLADFAFMGPFYAHLSRDPIPPFMIKTTAPLVWEWVERVTGLGRLAGRDFGRWDAEKGNFPSVYGA